MTLKRLIKIFLGKDFYTKVQNKCPMETHGNPRASFTINPDLTDKDSIVYSFGISSDISSADILSFKGLSTCIVRCDVFRFIYHHNKACYYTVSDYRFF